MIITELRGGLGNQMFCYATGYAVAKRANVPHRIDSTRFMRYSHRTPQIYSFPISAHEASPDERSRVATNGIEFAEHGLAFEPKLMEIWDCAYLRGFWQSETYFCEFRRDILLNQFIPMGWAFDRADVEIAKQMRHTVSVAVHIRRGDYVSNPVSNKFHGVLTSDYYRAASARVLDCILESTATNQSKASNSNGIVYFIFSDDIEWASSNLQFLDPQVLVHHNGPERGHFDMYLMSQANHHIIANSTFSWWGAWLCNRPGQIVVAPKQWFQDADTSSKDIIPQRWIQI